MEDIQKKLRKLRTQARQRHPNCMVVPYDDAKKLIKRAYNIGCQDGRNSDKSFIDKLIEYNRSVFNEFNSEDYE